MNMFGYICTIILTASISSGITYSLLKEEESYPETNQRGVSVERNKEKNTKRFQNENCTQLLSKYSADKRDEEDIVVVIESETKINENEERHAIRETFSNNARDQVNLLRTFMTGNDNDSGNLSLQSRFESENIDYEWSYKKEEELVNLFSEREELSGVSPLDLSCRSKNCQVVIAVTGGEQQDRVYQSFLNAVMEQQSGNGLSTVTYFHNEEKGTLEMYVSENGLSELLK